MLIQSVSSVYRCVWCGADARAASTKGGHHVAEEMVTIDDQILAQLLTHHHMLAASNARICKVSLHISSPPNYP